MKISILGSTGSIGTQTLDIIKENKEFKAVGLTTFGNIDLLEKQIKKFNPEVVAVVDENKAMQLKSKMKNSKVEILSGYKGLNVVASLESADMILTSVVGISGLIPTVEAIKAGKNIALANKETLVTAGHLVMDLAKRKNVKILPIDSEHSAIFQALKSGKKNEVKKLILTASGGPFRGKTIEQLDKVKAKDALKHPTWNMGKKISVDSATLMNKGLEVIEAKWLFDIEIDKIDILVHPQSIIHSMVEYIDGSIIAQLGVSDMRIPIQYALTYPKRIKTQIESLDLAKLSILTFEKPDTINFPCLKLAYDAIREGGTMPTVLNGANEILVDFFLKDMIKFNDIPKYIDKVMNIHNNIKSPNLNDIIEVDKWSRKKIIELIQ